MGIVKFQICGKFIALQEDDDELINRLRNEITPTEPNSDDLQDDSKYLIVPLVVLIFVMILSILVYLMAKRRRMNKLRKNILSLYEFDSNEQEWESLTNSNEYSYYTRELVTSF